MAYKPVKRAAVNVAAAQTDAELVAAVPGKRIRVRFLVQSCGGTATTTVLNTKGSGAGTAISPVFANGINGGSVLGDNEAGWFDTNVGEALTVTTGAGASTGYQVGYELV